MPSPSAAEELVVAEDESGLRLDAFLVKRFPLHSRVQWRKVIAADGVRVEGKRTKVAYRLVPGQRVAVQVPELPKAGAVPENIPLHVLYEDDWLVAVNKPPAMVVHPSRGHWSGTLASALAYHFKNLSSAGGPTRPGIVHRLDRDTSGVIIIAKTDAAHYALSRQFQARTMEKEYFGIVVGVPDRDRDTIAAPIGVHPYQREKMAVRALHSTTREASTFYEVSERFAGFAALRIFPKTGRTHQIRVHLAHVGHPILCDKLYGGRSQITQGELTHQRGDETLVLTRTALHARRLALTHPHTNLRLEFVAELPDDIERTLAVLRAARREK